MIFLTRASVVWLTAHSISHGQSFGVGPSFGSRGLVVAEQLETTGLSDRAVREAKGKRYNGGVCDITSANDQGSCVFEQYEPRRLPLLPLKQSTVVFIGRVLRRRGYLSADRTHIYTETTLGVQEVLRHKNTFRLQSDQSLIVDQIGGQIQISSGQSIRDDTRSGFLGKLEVGRRYAVFAAHSHEGMDLIILKAYELQDGKVFTVREDGVKSGVLLSSKPRIQDWRSKESSLLRALRR